MVTLIDAHAHLIPPWFPIEELPNVIDRAKKNNVNLMNNCSSDPSSYDFVLKTAKLYPEIFPTLGLQPTIASEESFSFYEQFVYNHLNELVALGEVGLDYYWVTEEPQREIQRNIFMNIIILANEVKKPLIVHTRKAELDSMDMLIKYATVPVYMHSFEGNADQIKRCIDNNYLIGIPTSVASRHNLKKIAQRTPLESTLLETDSPFLPVHPTIRPNEPKWIVESAKIIAGLHDTDIIEVARITTRNAVHFHKLTLVE